MFDEDQSIVTGIAKLVVLLSVNVLSIDYVVLALSPSKELYITLVLFGVVEVEHVLFDLLVC